MDMRDWFPSLDKIDPNLAEAFRRMRSDQLELRDVVLNLKKSGGASVQSNDQLQLQSTLATLSGYDLFGTGNSQSIRTQQGSIVPATTGTFNWSYTTTSITWQWTGLLWYPSDLWASPQRYLAIPDGSQANTGLAPSTTYYFYPYYDISANAVKFALDPALVVGSGYAHSAKSVLAAQEQNGDNHVPLSNGAMAKATPAAGTGSGTGDGGSECIRVGALVDRRGSDSPVRLETCHKGDFLAGWFGWVEILEHRICHRDDFIRLVYPHDSIDVTPTHLCPNLDVRESKHAHLVTLDDVGWMRDSEQYFPAKLNGIQRVTEEDDYVALTVSSPNLLWAGILAPDILNHNSLPAK